MTRNSSADDSKSGRSQAAETRTAATAGKPPAPERADARAAAPKPKSSPKKPAGGGISDASVDDLLE